MGKELAYALLTPYSLLKSRTGGIISRLLSMSNLKLVGARMYTPSDEFIDKYIETIKVQEIEPFWGETLIDYLNDKLRKVNKLGMTNRTMLLLFEGEDAVNVLHDHIGHISDNLKGDTIRGTYGDCIRIGEEKVEYFEPAVLTSIDQETNIKQLNLFAEYALSDGGILDSVMSFGSDEKPETGLVILKPFEKYDPRPGSIVDMISKTGFFIVGIKILNLSVEQAEAFYGPVKEFFMSAYEDKFRPDIVEQLKEGLSDQDFPFELTTDILQNLADQLKGPKVDGEFGRIINYMTGQDPASSGNDKEKKNICIALLYQGVNAINTIRDILGATDPKKAKDLSVRKIYGLDILRNAAHASDSTENAQREREIIGLWKEEDACDVKEIIEQFTNKSK